MICRYFVFFMAFSVCGWAFETIYGMLYTGKWENRGFFYGPICPIYGTGAVSITFIYEQFLQKFHGFDLQKWHIFAICFFGSIVLEYATSYVLEKVFHARWWDYENLPLNINGRVCFPASFLFGVAGLFVVYILYPFTTNISHHVSTNVVEFLALILMMIVSIDGTLTISALTNFEKYVAEFSDAIDEHMEAFMANVQEKRELEEKKIDEERARFAAEYAGHKLSAMGKLHLKATLRVKSFAYKLPDKTLINKYIDQVKDYIGKK